MRSTSKALSIDSTSIHGISNSARLEKCLAMYATAGIAAAGLFAAPMADAEVIYTPAHMVMKEGVSFPLDVNHDGITDFLLSNAKASSFVQNFGIFPQPQNAVLAQGVCFTTAGIPPVAAPAALSAGAEIGQGRQFESRAPCMRWDTSSDIQGHWQDVTNRYLGLGLVIEGKLHYGWARLSTKGNRSFIAVLTGYAYETEPGKAIVAGDEGQTTLESESAKPNDGSTAAAPQALTLGALALGSAK
jgi:hypothetical protein